MIADETIERALALMRKSPANAEYFLEKLTSPAWIEPFEQHQLFASPYPPQETEGGLAFPFWSPGDYLARMAEKPEAQSDVVRILLRLPHSENPRVYESIADASSALPVHLAVTLAAQLLRGAELPFPLQLPDKIVDEVVRFADAGFPTEALLLARALFAILPSTPSDEGGDASSRWLGRKARARLRDWEYGEQLGRCTPHLAGAAGIDALDMLCDLLEDAVAESSLTSEPQGPEDYSYVWRPTIEHPDGAHGDVRDHLVSAARDAAVTMGRESSEALRAAVEHLRARPTTVFWRIALHVLHTSPD